MGVNVLNAGSIVSVRYISVNYYEEQTNTLLDIKKML